jgi:predicted nucleic acid-binding protein
MRFWDSSALIPLFIRQDGTEAHLSLLSEDPQLVVWYGSSIECASAFNRLLREGFLAQNDFNSLQVRFETFSETWIETQPTDRLRERSIRLLRLHPLRAADSLQLAAALIVCEENPRTLPFVCGDLRLREAAAIEGFPVLP